MSHHPAPAPQPGFKVRDAVRVIGGAYSGWRGNIHRISKNGVATVDISNIPGIHDLDFQAGNYIRAGVLLSNLEHLDMTMPDPLTLTEAVQAAAFAVTTALTERIEEHEDSRNKHPLTASLHVVNDGKPSDPKVIWFGLATQGIFGIAIEMVRDQAEAGRAAEAGGV